jgi:hypothetical protein
MLCAVIDFRSVAVLSCCDPCLVQNDPDGALQLSGRSGNAPDGHPPRHYCSSSPLGESFSEGRASHVMHMANAYVWDFSSRRNTNTTSYYYYEQFFQIQDDQEMQNPRRYFD